MAKVLIVDDATFMRMMLKNILTSNGHTIVGEAEDGELAIEEFKRTNPDLVIMDITMPVLDGISAVKEIKKLNPKVKILICSALGQQALVIEAIQAGASDYIVKPFEIDKVVATIKKIRVG